MSDLHPIGPALRERNRLVLAKRMHWPAEAAGACRAMERDHPGWLVWYTHGGLPSRMEPGYGAGVVYRTPSIYADNPGALRALIAEQPHPAWPWA